MFAGKVENFFEFLKAFFISDISGGFNFYSEKLCKALENMIQIIVDFVTLMMSYVVKLWLMCFMAQLHLKRIIKWFNMKLN
jgi:hypothetical protein